MATLKDKLATTADGAVAKSVKSGTNTSSTKNQSNSTTTNPVTTQSAAAAPATGAATTSGTKKSTSGAGAATSAPSNYTSVNDNIHSGNGSSYDKHVGVRNDLSNWFAQNPEAGKNLTTEELIALGQQHGIDASLFGQNSQNGGYTQDRNQAIAGGGTGNPETNFYADGTWYYYPGQQRPTVQGTSNADKDLLSDGAYQLVKKYQADWSNYDKLAKEAEKAGKPELAQQYYAQRDQAHVNAEQVRLADGNYVAGLDGSGYFTAGEMKLNEYNPIHELIYTNRGEPYYYNGGVTYPGSGGASGGGSSGGSSGGSGGVGYPGGGTGQGATNGGANSIPGSQNDLQAMLQAWQDAAIRQNKGQVDYAVEKAVADLERALADAQPMFKEQAESVDRDARQAMDNSALYAEMRGDKGGIGQEQYNSIQNTQAQNHLSVQQAQTKLATDTQRQIADLRAQGEFEKADAALQVTQQYLQQLIGLEQWAREYNLSVEQFQASLKQWEAEYNLAMQKFETSKQQWASEFGFQQQQYQNSLNQWQQQFDASQNQWQQEFDFAQKQYQNSLDQWEREFAAEQMLAQMKLANSGGSGGSGNTKLSISDIDLGAAYQYLYDNNFTNRSSTDAIVAMLGTQGIPSDVAKQVAALYVDNGYAGLKNAGQSNGTIINQTPYSANEAMWDRGSNSPTQVTVPDSKPFYQSADKLNLPVYGFDLPPLIEMLRQYGAIEEGADGYLRWKNGWNASNYSSRLSQIAGEAIWDRHS